jgi:NADH-quinone oxidoreductase subunit N
LLLTSLLHEVPLAKQRVHGGIDIDVLLVFAVCGAMVMVSAANLLSLFLGFELLSVCVYALSGTARHERGSAEAALKYFILGAFSSAFLLYGMVLVYGAVGSLSLAAVSGAVNADSLLVRAGLGLMLFGLGFKVSLVPFHLWTPDVYQGAPSSITGFMATVVKAAAFGALLRVLTAFADIEAAWQGILWTLAALSMTIGNFAAIRQRSLKRMLAYSSIAHAGYVLVGFLALRSDSGVASVIFYLFSYALATFAAFGVVLLVSAGTNKQYARDDIAAFSGLGWQEPFLGVVMTAAVLSLAGIPPLAGFVGKFFLFRAALDSGYLGLVVIAALNTIVSLYYYLRVPVVMYFGEGREDWTGGECARMFIPRGALAVSFLGAVYLGLFPGFCYQWVETAVSTLPW